MSQLSTNFPPVRTLYFQRSLWFFVQAVAFLSSVFAFSKVATAESCGHYLFRNGVPVNMASVGADHDATMPFQQRAEWLQDAGFPASPDVPCNGPGCKNRSKPMLPGSSPVTLSVTTDPAILASRLMMANSSDEATAIPQSETGDVFRPLTIFRPPAC